MNERVSDTARLHTTRAKLSLVDATVHASVEEPFHLTRDLLEATAYLESDLAVEDRTVLLLAEAAHALLEVWKSSTDEGGHVGYVAIRV